MTDRRSVLATTVWLGVALAGCSSGIGGQPDAVPVEVTNASDEPRTYELRLTDTTDESASESLLTMEGDLSPGETNADELRVSDPNATYAVEVAVDGDERVEHVSASGLRSLSVVVGTDGVRIDASRT
jgi:hypothetical protein